MKKLLFLITFFLCLSGSMLAHKQALIILFGSPGSGKGTLAQNLCKQGGYQHVSAGDVLRAEVQAQTELGKQIEPLVKQGVLIDVHITAEIIKKKIATILESGDSCILDGFPRSVACVKEYDRIIKDLNPENIVYIELCAEPKMCLERISKRLVCDACHHVARQHEDMQEGVLCPSCQNASLKRRLNDTHEVATRRIEQYNQTRKDLFQRIDGSIAQIDAQQPASDCVIQAKKIVD